MVFRVEVVEGPARGFVCENYGAKFRLPGRGPIGANCLANPRDFKTPVAAFEDRETPSRLIVKWCGQFHVTEIGQSPLDVVAWHGNYAPCKYDLKAFSPVGAILFDHPDPSIFTVLTAPSSTEGTANIDFVLFRDRWNVAEHTFRPPWYHKNIMSELMGNIFGIYDAKPEGFVPGGLSLHNMMLPHGPDNDAFTAASTVELAPQKLENTMSFMFETRFPQHLTEVRGTRGARCRTTTSTAGRASRSTSTAGRTPAPRAEPLPLARSWVESANSAEAEFPLNNLPCGVFADGGEARCGVAIGDCVLDVRALERGGLMRVADEPLFEKPSWNDLMGAGPEVWGRMRERLTELLGEEGDPIVRDDAAFRAAALIPRAESRLFLPFEVAEYTDFYAGRAHATNVGTMFRGPDNALPPNWLHIPIGYNGRASTVVVSGTDIRRPLGQLKAPADDAPRFGPCERLDIELEMGTVVGVGTTMGQPIGVRGGGSGDLRLRAAQRLVGTRHPGMGVPASRPLPRPRPSPPRSSPWIVPAAALAPFRCDTPAPEKPLLPYLQPEGPALYDVELEIRLRPAGGSTAQTIARTNFRELYYSPAQQLCHHAVSGCAMRTGDLLGSGTISGPDRTSRGSLLEISWSGAEPLELEGGVTRSFLEDGDEVTLAGRASGDG